MDHYYFQLSPLLQYAWCQDFKRLIDCLSIQSEAGAWRGTNQKYFPILQKVFSKNPFLLPTEEDFCRAMKTLQNWGIHITPMKHEITTKETEELTAIIYANLRTDSPWIKIAFRRLAEIFQMDGYTFSRK